jgi:multidrug efflux pump subunit AcrB
MNAIVLIALKRPYTFVVLAILILIFGGRAALRTPTDVFPNIGIPVVAVIWTYNGLTPEDMSGRVIYYYERSLTTTVGNIEHIESQSLYGRGIVKVFFQPGTNVAAAQAQVTAISQTVLKQLPAGITPPQVVSYNASSVPVLELQVAADQMTGSQLYDLASNLIRPGLVSVPGVAIPAPYGGTASDVEVDLDQQKLLAHNLALSGGFTRVLSGASRAFAVAIGISSARRLRVAGALSWDFWRFRCYRSFSCPSLDVISFRISNPARSTCTFAHPSGCG